METQIIKTFQFENDPTTYVLWKGFDYGCRKFKFGVSFDKLNPANLVFNSLIDAIKSITK